MLDVSIIIVNWNTKEILKDCLRSIYDQTCDIKYEVIVVDNASSDDSVEMIKFTFPNVIIIANSENKGFAAANNQGMKISTGRYVLLLNPDTIVVDAAIQRTVQYMDENKDIGVLGCQVWLNENEIQKTCFPFPTVSGHLLQKLGLRRMFPKSIIAHKIDYGSWDRKCQMDVDVVSGMYMLVRNEAIEQVGLMDEDYFLYAEEVDWCFRFRKAGWRCAFTPIARIIHLDGGNKSTDLVMTKMFVQMQKSILIFHMKQRGIISGYIVKTIFIISMILRYIGTISLAKYYDKSKSQVKAEQSLATLKFLLFNKSIK